MKLQFKFTIKDTEYYRNWFSFTPKRWQGARLTFEPYGYFDPRPQICTNVTTLLVLSLLFVTGISWFSLLLIPFLFFGWGQIYLNLPFNSGKTDECDGPQYGFYFYGEGSIDGLWLRMGKRSRVIYMPWALNWYKTSLLLKDGTWEHETRGNNKDFYEDKWEDKRFQFEYNYTDKYDGTVVPTKVHAEKREWRRKWLMWTPLFNFVRETIAVEFSEEVGSRKGSWKGGTIGCGYDLRKGETPLNCIKRMEQERTF